MPPRPMFWRIWRKPNHPPICRAGTPPRWVWPRALPSAGMVPQLAGALRRMSEHLAEYLRGPEGTAEMLQLLGESPSGGMARGGTDEAPASADGTPTGGAEAEAPGDDAGIGGAP